MIHLLNLNYKEVKIFLKRYFTKTKTFDEKTAMKKLILDAKVCSAIEELYLVNQIAWTSAEELDIIAGLIRDSDINSIKIINNLDIRLDLIKIYLVVDDRHKQYLVGVVDQIDLYLNPYVAVVNKHVSSNIAELNLQKL